MKLSIHEFNKKYENNEQRITQLSEEILFLKGGSMKQIKIGDYRVANLLQILTKHKFFLRFERKEGQLELSKEDVDVLIENRLKLQEPHFKLRKELEEMLKEDGGHMYPYSNMPL